MAGGHPSGTNHVFPIGAAKVFGGPSVDTFLHANTVRRLEREVTSGLRETIRTLADTEGLEAHARSVDQQFEE